MEIKQVTKSTPAILRNRHTCVNNERSNDFRARIIIKIICHSDLGSDCIYTPHQKQYPDVFRTHRGIDRL